MEGKYKVNVGKDPAEDYALQAIFELNRGINQVEIVGYAENICKVVDVFLEMKSRLGDSLKISSHEIGSTKIKGKRSNYLKIVVEKTL
ncbi:MAG: DNA-binding protein [Caldisphaeraceae archaeon]|nr:DNA-binding protein [Caldisphaeraceae archaeon]MEB3692556.1 DNA-binding protein [Caldisphaeraceae archaeon]MEB3797734.1 DNA-binding protein [Caldisphaeraceae archaeon]